MNKLITAGLALAAVSFAMNTYYTQNRLSHLVERIQSIETHYSSLKYDFNSLVADDGNSVVAHTERYRLDYAIQTDRVSDSVPELDTQKAQAIAAQSMDASNKQRAASVKSVIEKVTETGYLNREIWDTVDQEIKEMDAKQNKLFWEEMISMIENNQIELYMDQ
jgi:hypothetical protein